MVDLEEAEDGEGFVDMVEDGKNGFLHDPNDTQGFETSLRLLLSSPEVLRSMRQASLIKSKNFDIENVVDQYEFLFLESVGANEK